MNAIIGSINSIDHLIFTLNPRIPPYFQEIVSSWLNEMKVTYHPKVDVNGFTVPIKIDFKIPRPGIAPVFMQALHASSTSSAKDAAYKVDFQITDLRDANIDFKSSYSR